MQTEFYLQQETKDKIKNNLLKYADIDITVDLENPFKRGSYKCLSVTCNICNYKAERNIAVLTKSRYNCKGCIAEKYKTLCDDINRTYISHTKAGSLLKINATCKDCENLLSFDSSTLNRTAKATRKCEHCLLVHYKKIALDAGYEYVVKGVRGLTIRCPKDGNEMFVRAAHLAAKSIICPSCLVSDYTAILNKKGCTFVELIRAKNVATRVVYTNTEGEIFDASTIAIKSNGFATHKETTWQDAHKTYMMLVDFNTETYCKIGTASDIHKRLRALKLPENARVITLDSFGDRFGATRLESELHSEFAEYRLGTNIPAQFTRKTTSTKRSNGEMYRVHDGSTEWFTHEVYEVLKTRYNLEKEELWHSV